MPYLSAMPAAHLLPALRERTYKPDAAKAPRGRLAWLALAYGTLGAIGALVATAVGNDAWTTTGWLHLDGPAAFGASVVLGLVVAAATVAATRAMVARAAWARKLREDLRPVIAGADDTMIVLTAIASGVGEELFFEASSFRSWGFGRHRSRSGCSTRCADPPDGLGQPGPRSWGSCSRASSF